MPKFNTTPFKNVFLATSLTLLSYVHTNSRKGIAIFLVSTK